MVPPRHFGAECFLRLPVRQVVFEFDLKPTPMSGSQLQSPLSREPLPVRYGYSSLRSNFLCEFQICKPWRSIT